MHDGQLNCEEFVRQVKEVFYEVINAGENIIKLIREYKNKEISEEKLILAADKNNRIVRCNFIKLSDFPAPPMELNTWFDILMDVSGIILDLSLYYNKENIEKWDSDNRRVLADIAITNYGVQLEKLKEAENSVSEFVSKGEGKK